MGLLLYEVLLNRFTDDNVLRLAIDFDGEVRHDIRVRVVPTRCIGAVADDAVNIDEESLASGTRVLLVMHTPNSDRKVASRSRLNP